MCELQEVLEFCEIDKISEIAPKLFRRLVKCVTGDNMEVADKAMCFFEQDFFKEIFKTYKSISFLMVVPLVIRMSNKHKNPYFSFI